jgi:hypothetical protein
LALSLVSFNIGVELGQLLVIALAIPALALLFKRVVAERMGTMILSALVAHTAWHWMLDRWAILRQYHVQWPTFDLPLLASTTRGLMLVLIVGAAGWAMFELHGRLVRRPAVTTSLASRVDGD